MAIKFSEEEKRILGLFKKDEIFDFEDEKYIVEFSGKPTCSKGEPKTDVFVRAKRLSNGEVRDIKISFKKSNAEFLENKIKEERMQQILGEDWEKIVSDALHKLQYKFHNRTQLFKVKEGRTEEGAITLGWKIELLTVKSGELSEKIDLSVEQLLDVYAGNNLDLDKKHAFVNGEIIQFSGVAEYILFSDQYISSLQKAVDLLLPIEQYIEEHPEIFFACKALNYRSYKQKWDGNRPLAVYLDWFVEEGRLNCNLVMDQPLSVKGNEVAEKLRNCLKILDVQNTNDLNENNVCSNVRMNGTHGNIKENISGYETLTEITEVAENKDE